MSPKNSDHYFLRGGGAMGELIRAKDWTKTALGDPADWPQSLCTMVAVMLENPFGMYIAWGSEYTQLYNDAYRPILGMTKHPQALGLSTRETFSEIWHIIGSMFDGVMKGEAVGFPNFMLPLNRNGYVEASYFDFSYSPIRKSDGEVGGVLVTVIETTSKKNAEESLKENSQRFRDTMKQAPVGITILRGPQYVVEMANDVYLQLVGKEEAEFVGSPLFTSLPEVEEAVRALLDGVLNTGVPYHGNELPIPINRYGKHEVGYFDFLYHPLKEEDGKISGIIVSATEVTEKVETRKSIEESKRLYEAITQNTPDLIYVFDVNYRFTYANEALLKMWGRSWENAVGKGMLEVGYEPWHAQQHEREIDEVIATKKPVRGEVSFPHATLGHRIYDYIFAPVIDRDGKVEAVAGTTRDITPQVEARKQIEEKEKRFRNMVQQAPVAISVLRGENFVVEVANDRQLKLWGKTKEQVIDRPIFTAIPEGAGQGYEELLSEVFATGIPFIANEAPITLIRNGITEIFYVNFVYEPLYDGEHKIDGVLSVATEVTEHVMARKKIEESEERFQAAIQAVDGILWTNNGKGEMEGVQAGWASLTGQDYEDYRGFGWANAVHPDDAQPTVDAWNKAVEARKTFIFEHRVKAKEGQWRDFSIRAIPLLNSDGTVRQWVGVHTDITDSKQAAKALKANEEKLTIVIEASELGTWEVDLTTGRVTGSDRFCEIMEFPKNKELTEADREKGAHPDYLKARENAFKNAFETGVLNFKGPRIREDQSILWIEVKGKVFYDEEKNPITIIGTVEDITKEREQQQILLESEQKFRLLADSMPQLIWTSDTQGHLNYFNQSVFDYSGLSLSQLNKDGWIQIVHPDDREENIKKWMDAINTGKDFLLEHRFRRHDGKYHWQLSRAIPQRDKKGTIQMWVGTSTDIQQQKTFARELEKQVTERTKELEHKNSELETMNEELKSFTYISSHDLQEPLRKIQTFATRILETEQSNLTDTGKDMFNRMQNTAKRMQTLLIDLLAYARTNTIERKFETTDLNKIIEEVKEDFEEELQRKQATIESTVMGEVNIIPFQFRQLMHNLIGNALKFSNPNQTPHIQIKSEMVNGLTLRNQKLSPLNNYCRITVSDNGIGFEQQYSKKIFDVFQRLHGKSEYNGTGIGLSIVKKIVDNHNGIIKAIGEVGKGATFDIYIPQN